MSFLSGGTLCGLRLIISICKKVKTKSFTSPVNASHPESSIVTTNAFRTLSVFISSTTKTGSIYETSVTFGTLRFVMFFPVCLAAVMTVVVHVGMRSRA